MKYGFIKVAAAVPAVKVADVVYNVQEIEKLISLADSEHVEIVCFPELCITGYTCQDLFKEQLLLTKAEEGFRSRFKAGENRLVGAGKVVGRGIVLIGGKIPEN